MKISKEEEYNLIHLCQTNKDRKALSKLFIAYKDNLYRAAVRFANKFNVDSDDLFQQATLGFIEAVDKFDMKRNTRLLTLAYFYINKYIKEYIDTNWNIVHCKYYDKHIMFVLSAKKQKMLRDGIVEEECVRRLSEEYEITAERVNAIIERVNMKDYSMDTLIYDRNGFGFVTFGETISDGNDLESDVIEYDELVKIKKIINQALEVLSERDQEILRRHFFEEEPQDMKKIGKHFGVSREWIRIKRNKSLAKLKEQLKTDQTIKQFLGV